MKPKAHFTSRDMGISIDASTSDIEVIGTTY